MKNKFVLATVGVIGIAALSLSLQINVGAAEPASNSRLARLLTGKEPPRLTVAQAEAFAQQNNRRPEILLVAYQASLEKAFLREAMEKFPRDARVAMAAACMSGKELEPTRRAWLNAFKSAAPTNALADYLSAQEHFKTGLPAVAVQEALDAAGKPMTDYATDWIQNTEKAYRSIGYSEAEAKAVAMVTLMLPHLAQLRDVGKNLIAQANLEQNKGNEASAQKLFQAAAKLGARLDGPGTPTLIQVLVGISIQKNILDGLDPITTFGDSGQTVRAQIDQLTQRRDSIRATAKQFNDLLLTLPEKDIAAYFDQQKHLGEEAAEKWALNKYGNH